MAEEYPHTAQDGLEAAPDTTNRSQGIQVFTSSPFRPPGPDDGRRGPRHRGPRHPERSQEDLKMTQEIPKIAQEFSQTSHGAPKRGPRRAPELTSGAFPAIEAPRITSTP